MGTATSNETQICACGGTMHHSSDMDDPSGGTGNHTPFWQCEKCGEIVDDIPTYQIAVMNGSDGSWDTIETFEATDDDAATAHAEQHHGDIEWYILDSDGDNIYG